MTTQSTLEPRTLTLKDDITVTIRPLAENDRDAMLDFGSDLPEDDALYFEDNLQSPEIITRFVNAHAAENWRQVVATADGKIVGYSVVRRLPGWSSHVGEILLVVRRGWRRKGVGTALAQAIFEAAPSLGVTKLITEMLDEHVAGRAIFERLGFRVEGDLSEHAQDRQGKLHHLLIFAYHIR
jgi:L-amino acid N-acyltransferase YncA